MSEFTKNLCSIILPVYNSKKFLAKTLKSISDQTYKNWELIIVNDASEENLENIISEFSRENEGKVIYTQNTHNKGVGISVVKASELAKGEFVTQIGHDDIFEPDFLQKQIEALDNNPEIISVFSKVNYINANDNIETHHQLFRNNIINNLNRYEIFCELIKGNFLCACSGVFRNSPELQEYFGYSNDVMQDLELWCNLITKGKFQYNDTTSTNYRIHKNNFSLKNKKIAQIQFEESSCILRILFSENFYNFFSSSSDKIFFLKNILSSLLSHSNNKSFEIITPAFLEYLLNKNKYLADDFKHELAALYQSIGLVFKAYNINDGKLPIPSETYANKQREQIEEIDNSQISNNISKYLKPTKNEIQNILNNEIKQELLEQEYKNLKIEDSKITRDSITMAKIEKGLGGLIENALISENKILLQGWAANLHQKHSAPKAILAFHNQEIIGYTTPEFYRNDIKRFFGKNNSKAGFEISFKKDYPDTLCLVSLFDDGTYRILKDISKYNNLISQIIFTSIKIIKTVKKLKRLVKSL